MPPKPEPRWDPHRPCSEPCGFHLGIGIAYHQAHHGIKQPRDGPAGSAHVGAGQRAGRPLPPGRRVRTRSCWRQAGGGRAKTAASRSDQKRKSEASPNDVALAIL